MMEHPLDGITVVSLEQAVAAPFATRQLADLGARVIKVERPGTGDFARGYDETVRGMSSHFVWLNRSKESVVLDLKDPGHLGTLHELIARADVFVQNLGPGAAARLGLDATTLRDADPRLIHTSISGYGDGGPYTAKKAYDLLVQCEAGFASITGTPRTPSKAGISIADIAAGMYAYSGILTALFERERTGEGTTLEISMLEALGEWMGYPLNYAVHGGSAPRRTGARHASIAPYGPYTCGDGLEVFLGLQNDREWALLCREVLQAPELVTDERFSSNSARVRHGEELDAVITAALARHDADEVIELLDTVGIATARLRDMQAFAEHPQLAARDRWVEHDSPVGPLRALIPPATPKGRTPVMGSVPALGEDTDRILAEVATASADDGGTR